MESSARVVLIGASNLTLGFSTVVEGARAALGAPLEILGAFGHGRSFGAPTRVLGRRLPGILDCGLWRALEAGSGAPTYAVVTDVGNDIGYGVPAETLAGWVEETLERLASRGATTVLTLLPQESLERVGVLRFYAARTLLFPSCRLRREDILERALHANARLRELAARMGISAIDPPLDWFALDPIHIRRRRRREAWSSVLARWGREPAPGAGGAGPLPRTPWRRRDRFLPAPPEESWLLWIHRRRPQPARTLPDGTTLALY